jgi:DNA polymerase-4
MKSVGAERTFDKNLSSEIYMEERLKNIAEEIERRIKKNKIAGKTITLKIKYSDFSQQTRSKTVQYFISDKNLIFETAKELLYQEKLKNSVRLLGISLNNLNNSSGDIFGISFSANCSRLHLYTLKSLFISLSFIYYKYMKN